MTGLSVNDSAITPRRILAWLAIAAVLGVTVLLLRGEGRMWICSCGTLSIWSGQVCSANNSQQFLDPFSFTHVLHGFAFAFLVWRLLPRLTVAWSFCLAITLGSLWEVFENSDFIINRYRTETAALGYQGDTIVNSFGDILCCVVGFMIARQLGFRRSLVLFLAVEFVLLVWIRDSLLLEIVMLVRPIEVIKQWQLCR